MNLGTYSIIYQCLTILCSLEKLFKWPKSPKMSFVPCTEIRPTEDRGMGLFATRLLEEDKLFYEYTGVVKTKSTWDQDKVRYVDSGNVTCYAVEFGRSKNGPKEFILDSTEYGNNGRFSNGSHFPNTTLEEVIILRYTVCTELDFSRLISMVQGVSCFEQFETLKVVKKSLGTTVKTTVT